MICAYAGGERRLPGGLVNGTIVGTPYQPRFMAVDVVGMPLGMVVAAVMTHSHSLTYPPAPRTRCTAARLAGVICQTLTAVGENELVTFPPRSGGAKYVPVVPLDVTPVKANCIASSLEAL